MFWSYQNKICESRFYLGNEYMRHLKDLPFWSWEILFEGNFVLPCLFHCGGKYILMVNKIMEMLGTGTLFECTIGISDYLFCNKHFENKDQILLWRKYNLISWFGNLYFYRLKYWNVCTIIHYMGISHKIVLHLSWIPSKKV